MIPKGWLSSIISAVCLFAAPLVPNFLNLDHYNSFNLFLFPVLWSLTLACYINMMISSVSYYCIILCSCLCSLTILKLAVRGMKGKLNNLMVQLRKNCVHPDLLEAAFDGSCTSL